MMTTKEMKQILTDKLKAENTCFKKSDISISKYNNGYKIVIKDYEHIIFIIKFEIDDWDNQPETTLWKQYKGYKKRYLLNLEENQDDEVIKDTLIYLGYYIGTRF